MSWLIVLAFLAALAILGPRYGADTRDGRDWSSASARRRNARRSGSRERAHGVRARAASAH